MSWTEERIKTLRDLWARGCSASDIARTLGKVSRNAVIGKAHRLGLSGRPSPIRKTKAEKPVVKAPAGNGATILTLNDRMCKWPEGDPREAGFHFCGKASHPGLPYCREHAQMAYQPARRRDDKNRAA
ncbi:MAG: GcrA family cell cycle regulator [Pseudomonadota bacterium]|nr:GcrA family cell cycle regulator [Pseudomonadota bacterium]